MRKLLLGIFAILMGVILISPISVFADNEDTNGNANNCVNTSILGDGEVCDNGNGDSIFQVLKLVIDIMTIGIGILGVVGISIVGIQYLTAGGSEEKTRKAKRRLFEIIIGLVAYAVMYALLGWLLPGFNTTTTTLNNVSFHPRTQISQEKDNSKTI